MHTAAQHETAGLREYPSNPHASGARGDIAASDSAFEHTLTMERAVPPHPGPLPWGEGEPPAATGRDVAINAPARAAPSP